MLKYLAGPIIGAIIGYFTNYIAVKMLFYPKKEIRFCGKKLPFTPGAIPKGKPRLAKAVGEIVGKTLITKEDIESKIVLDDISGEISNVLINTMNQNIKDIAIQTVDGESDKYESIKEKVAIVLSDEVLKGLSKVDMAEIIATKGGAILKEKVQGTMLQMFLTDDMIKSFTGPIGEEIKKMISEQGMDYVYPIVNEKLDEMENENLLEALNRVEIGETEIKNMVSSIIGKILKPSIEKIFDGLDLVAIVEEKINLMSVDELEEMVLLVMKKELNMIVNLGALIGFILGLLNIII